MRRDFPDFLHFFKLFESPFSPGLHFWYSLGLPYFFKLNLIYYYYLRWGRGALFTNNGWQSSLIFHALKRGSV